jgi:hypothetical protein
MAIHLYNSLTRKTEPLTTIEAGVVRMYVCGVTVYDEAHIGHAMSAVAFDTIRRYLEHAGYAVRHVVNFTDVDDKIIARAAATGSDPIAMAARYAEEFLVQLGRLNVLPATEYPRATQTRCSPERAPRPTHARKQRRTSRGGRRPSPASRRGRARGAKEDPAGTSSARRCA